MFGISSFARTSFASLAGNAYALSITEVLTSASPVNTSGGTFIFLSIA